MRSGGHGGGVLFLFLLALLEGRCRVSHSCNLLVHARDILHLACNPLDVLPLPLRRMLHRHASALLHVPLQLLALPAIAAACVCVRSRGKQGRRAASAFCGRSMGRKRQASPLQLLQLLLTQRTRLSVAAIRSAAAARYRGPGVWVILLWAAGVV